MNKLIKYLTIIVFLSSALTVSAQSDEKAIRKGNRNYNSGNYEQAIANYQKALDDVHIRITVGGNLRNLQGLKVA